MSAADQAEGARGVDLGDYIREQRRAGHLSLRKLSELSGISNPYLSQIERGLRRPSAEILQQIARSLSISSETLYERAGILEPRAETGDLVAEIRRDPHLDEPQKRALVQIYQSFRASDPPSASEARSGVGPDVGPGVGSGPEGGAESATGSQR